MFLPALYEWSIYKIAFLYQKQHMFLSQMNSTILLYDFKSFNLISLKSICSVLFFVVAREVVKNVLVNVERWNCWHSC